MTGTGAGGSALAFASPSFVREGAIKLGLAPALTPDGVKEHASFFHGFLSQPQVYASGLLALAEITRTRYFQYTPSHLRDPVFTAHGDRLRAEVFSACNGVVARFDLDSSAIEGGAIGYGTTNVDLGDSMKGMLANMKSTEPMHLDVGDEGITVSTLQRSEKERRVDMPTRWIPAFGNAAGIHRSFHKLAEYDAAATRRILGQLPVTYRSGADAHWITMRGRIPRVVDQPQPGSVRIPGAHRLTAARRLSSFVSGMEVYGDPGAGKGAVVEFIVPGGCLSLGLTEQSWRGYSGEGALLVSLSAPQAAADADFLSALLAFEPKIDVQRMMREANLSERRVLDGLAVLAAEGRVGWDLPQQAYFHRELPHDPGRVEKDHPRVVSARTLVERGRVHRLEGGAFWVESSSQGEVLPGAVIRPDEIPLVDVDDGAYGYVVRVSEPGADTCSCPWISRSGVTRGPCKHILAARLLRDGEDDAFGARGMRG